MKFIFLVILNLIFFGLFAQTGTIKGNVKLSGENVEFIYVHIPTTKFGTYTDSSGNFILKNIPYGTYTIKAATIGVPAAFSQATINAATPNAVVNIVLKELNETVQLEEIVVSGTAREVKKSDSPVPVEVYSAKFFEANPAPSLFESIQNINGVRPQLNCNVCNTGDIHINGLEGPYTMILIDGMPIVSGLSTVYGLTGIPQAMIERIEVVKGPASTLYGSEAVGGVINVITKKTSKAPLFHGDAMLTSWGEANLDLATKIKSNKTDIIIGANYFNYSNPIDNNKDGFTDVTLQDRFSTFTKFNFKRKSKKALSVAGRYVYEDRWGGEMNWTPEFREGDSIYGESIYTSRWETFGTYELPLKEKIDFQFSANGHNQNSVYGDVPYLASQHVLFGQFLWHKNIKKHQLLTGLVYRLTRYDDNTPATNPASVTHLPGLFVQDEIKFNKQHTLLLGARYDYNSVHGNIVTPRLNYKWNSKNKKNIIRWSLGNGYRVANVFTEDHAALTGARKVEFQGELKPETSWNSNLNYVKKIYTKHNAYVGLDATAFYTFFNNRIVPDYETDVNKIIYANLDGQAVSQGISVNADIVLKNGITILAGVTAMDVSITENGKRTRQLLTEQLTGTWKVSYEWKKHGLTFDYTGNLYGPMRLPLLGDLDDRPANSPWWSIQNIQIRKKFKDKWEFYTGVKNLLNFTPPNNSIARSFDPFDKGVSFDNNGEVIATSSNPKALTFDPTYVFAPNQGIRGFVGIRYTIK